MANSKPIPDGDSKPILDSTRKTIPAAISKSVPDGINKSISHGGDLAYTPINSSYPSKYIDVVQSCYTNSLTSTPDITLSSRNRGAATTLPRQTLC